MNDKAKPPVRETGGNGGNGVNGGIVEIDSKYSTLPHFFQSLLQQADEFAERDPQRLADHNAVWHALFAAGLRHKFSPATEKQKRFLIRLIRELGKNVLSEARRETGIHASLTQLTKLEAKRLIDALIQRKRPAR